MFYVDKLKNDIWAIELDNQYALKNIGKFPNISAIAFLNNQLYLASRTKSRIAIVDYSTLGLIAEFTTVNKPIAMQIYDKYLYILGAHDNVIQKLNTESGKTVDTISLDTGGFSKGFNKLPNSDLAVITDVKSNTYTIFDLAKSKILKSYSTTIPIKDVIITDKVKLFN